MNVALVYQLSHAERGESRCASSLQAPQARSEAVLCRGSSPRACGHRAHAVSGESRGAEWGGRRGDRRRRPRLRGRARGPARRPAEVVIHEVTAISNASNLAHFDRGFAATNRLRTDGVDYLLAAARECGARRFIAQSFCGWPFARMGGPVKTEEDALDPAPPREFRNSLAAIHHLEGAVAGSTALEGVVLRYGAFYGPGTGLFDGGVVDQLRRRRIPVIGDGGGWWSFLHVDDAAEATALAVDEAPRGFTTSSTTSRRRCANGCRSSPGCSVPSRRHDSPLAWPDCRGRAYGRDDD